MGASLFTTNETMAKWGPTSTLLTSVAAAFLIWYLQYHWRRRHLYQLSSKVPGPKGWPIIGNILDFVGNSADIHDNIVNHFNASSGLRAVWYGPTLVYAVHKPEYLERILTNPKAFSKMYLYRYAVPLVGYGLFTAPVPIWKRHRKIIMPAFNQKVLDGFVEVFGRQCTIMGHQLEKFVGRGEFDLFPMLSRCSLDIVCEATMGIEVNAQTTDSAFGHWVERLLEIVFLRMFVVWYHFDFIFKWTKMYEDQCQFTEKFYGFTEKVIKEKRANFEKKIQSGTKRKAFLDLLVELSTGDNQLTDDELRDEVNTFMIAGSDTTASSSGFVFLMLGMHPDLQDKVYEEVVQVLGLDRMVEPHDLPLLKYTERVIKETLRLFPIGPFIVRDIEDDLPLKDDLILPKGSSAILGILPVHRRAEYWPDPLKFDPERFVPEEVAKRHPFSYLPFSGGPRNCIGPKYAMMAMKSMIATTVRKFKFSTSYKKVEDVQLKTNLILRPRNGFKISVELRNQLEEGL